MLGQISDTALTADKAVAFADSGLPNTFVPGRNPIFFTFAGAVAYREMAQRLGGEAQVRIIRKDTHSLSRQSRLG